MRAHEILTEAVKQRLDPKCWKGKHKEGTKIKGGVRVNNCVPNESIEQGVAEVMSQGNRDQGAIGHGLPWKSYDDLDQLAQDISDKILTITNIVKLNSMAHDSTIYNALERYFKKYGYPDNVFNRVASIVFKKLDNEGRRMTTDPRIQDQGVAEAGGAAQQAAIAINMKKHHKKPKNEDVYTEEELNLLFDSLEEMFESMDIHEDNYDAFTDENILSEAAAWQKKSGKNKNGGLNKKGVASYRRENPGSKLQTAVTTKPSKLKKGSKAAKRRKSFCARMKGMKKSRTGAKTKRDPNSRINKSLRKWNC
jgi:hypothetical protein